MAKQQELNKPEAEKIVQPILADEGKKASDTEMLVTKLLALLDEKQKKDPPMPAFAAASTFSYDKLNEMLVAKEPVAVAFPPCSDVLLGLIDNVSGAAAASVGDLRINHLFAEYFSLGDASGGHKTLPDNANQDRRRLDDLFLSNYCLGQTRNWPPNHCFPSPCIKIEGNRRVSKSGGKIRRLFIGDLAWLYYVERMGAFQMLGRILDEYAYSGGIPMSNGSVHQDVKDDMVALVLEAMTRQTEAGNSSKVRDRASSYLRCFNWNTEAGSALGLSTSVNTAFEHQFRKLMQLALQFFKDKRLGVAIRASNDNTGITSAATLVTIRDTINLLKRSFENFNYGRNYHNTLSGIVWAIAGLKLVEELRQTLGIPPEYTNPADFIPAAYDILVLKRPITSGESNRFETHMECARNIRSILLDLEVLNFSNTDVNGDLEGWLNSAESSIEGYRTAYRTLTGIDLGADTATA